MRTADFAPLYRSTVGFDHLFRLIDTLASDGETANSFPPYNIERTDENAYRITMAVAGFGEGDLEIEVKEGSLVVRGRKAGDTDKREFLHRGIAERSFERRFQLADHVEVDGADLRDGLLHIKLKRNLPERLKPRQIAINADGTPTQIEAAA
ncbi:MAG: Hsp20 family protein [Pseudomonadota bacterium]